MAESILQKSGGGAASDECSATKAQILTGYTAITSDSNDEPIAGTMPNRGAISQTLNCGGSYTIPAGWHNGAGKVTANSLASQTSGTATAAQIYTGKTAWVNGTKLTGTMTVSSVVSFSVAAYSTSQILCTWKNPAKGPYSGVAICAKTGGYPTNAWDSRVYTGVGSNKALNATSTATVGGLTAGTTYYFRIWVYCTCSAGELWSGYQQAIGEPTANGRKAFTASGTFTVPVGVRSIDIHCTGGGGGGGYGSSSSASGSGNGGGGGYTSYKTTVSVVPGQTITVIVGTGGIGNGADGSESYVTINGVKHVSALGGLSGTSSSISKSNGGSGGGAGGHNAYIETSGAGAAGGTNGGNGGNARRPNNQGWGNPGTAKGGTGQGTSTKEFGTGATYSGGGGGAGGGSGSIGGAGGAGGGGKGGNGKNSRVGGTDGSAGTGGGGGGAMYNAGGNAGVGKGGSGNVIVRW